MNRYIIGIDTGGTFTDGVLIHYRTRRVVSTAKSLTTRDDLKKGVINVLNDLDLREEHDVRLVGISSTLATNSVAEGKARKVGLLLIGYDKELVDNYGLTERFATENVAYFQGGHNAQGAELAPLKLDEIKKWIRENEDQVDAIAISSYFSPLNPEHEERVFEVVKEISDLPVVLGHQLSTKLDSIKRAATASLNASLVAVMQDFIQAVQNSMKDKGVKAPLMIVRGDGTLLPYTEAVQKPVETVLSGPAASAIGGHFLSRQGSSLVIDVGSTTTDMAVVQNSRVVVSETGARVGDTETAVEAAKIRTVSIGCDSRISLDKYKNIVVGPDKVTPLSQLASRYESVAKELYPLPDRTSLGVYFTNIEFWCLYKQLDDSIYDRLGPIQQKVIQNISNEPISVRKIMQDVDVYHPAQLGMDELIRQGYIECATLTPSDLLHISGDMNIWDSEAAKAALDYICHLPRLKKTKFIEQTIDKIVSTIVEEIIIFLASQDEEQKKLPEKLDSKWGQWFLNEALSGKNDFITVKLDTRVPLIGTGAPAEFFLKRAAEHIKAHFMLPKHYEVANAVGAVSGSIMETKEAIVFTRETQDIHTFVVQIGDKKKHFEEFEEACEYAEEKIRKVARNAAIEAGAVDPYVEVKIKTEGSLQRYIARALGNPKISERGEEIE